MDKQGYKQHKVAEEQLHLAATMWTAQMLREPLQCAALDIAQGVGGCQEFSPKLSTHKI
jgi:hypothetical protein